MRTRSYSSVLITTFFVLAITAPVLAQEQRQIADSVTGKQHHHYRLIDVGTFGGPASFINAEFNSFPALNDQGILVGGSATPVPWPANTNPFGCGGTDGNIQFIFHSFAVKDGVVTDLGALSPKEQNCSNAQAVNARGEIVGFSENGLIDPVTGLNENRATLWKNGEVQDLGTLGGPHSVAFGINNRGQVAGTSLNDIPDAVSILDSLVYGTSNGTQTRAFVWERGHMQDLGTLGGPDALAFFINQRGQITGFSYTNSTPNATTGLPTQDPFLWEDGTMIDLGTLGGTSGSPTALNNAGQVIGVSNLAGDQTHDPFLWEKGNLIDLATNTIGATAITANAINDAGEIVGAAAFANAPFDAYLRKKGAASDLGHLSGDCFSEAIAINSRGEVVGYSTCDFANVHPILWKNGLPIDLNSTIPANSSLQLVIALAINERGEIAGLGVPASCPVALVDFACGHAFLLIPCGEPGDGCEDGAAIGAAASNTGLEQARQPPTAGNRDNPSFRGMPSPTLRSLRDRMMSRYRGLEAQQR
jgi:probable HAF family extracellular repeat protein